MMRALDDAILKARFDPDVHVLVLTGSGERFFCAGADIRMLDGTAVLPGAAWPEIAHEALMASGAKQGLHLTDLTVFRPLPGWPLPWLPWLPVP